MKFTGTKDYVATDDLKIAVNASIVLERPLLIKGEPGTGKTVLAEEVAKALGAPLLTWHIKSTTKAQQGLYEYDAVSRLRDSQLGDARVSDISNYIKRGKLWDAFTHDKRPVLLIDEIDKADIEFPNDLLLELDRMEFFVYETGENIKAKLRPIVMITSNNEKELPDAFLRRCFFHYIKFPDVDTMNRIVDVHFPGIKKRLVEEALRIFFEVREVPGLKKKPSTSELLDWLKLLLNEDITPEMLQGARSAQADPAAARRAAEKRAGRASVRAAGVPQPPRSLIGGPTRRIRLRRCGFEHQPQEDQVTMNVQTQIRAGRAGRDRAFRRPDRGRRHLRRRRRLSSDHAMPGHELRRAGGAEDLWRHLEHAPLSRHPLRQRPAHLRLSLQAVDQRADRDRRRNPQIHGRGDRGERSRPPHPLSAHHRFGATGRARKISGPSTRCGRDTGETRALHRELLLDVPGLLPPRRGLYAGVEGHGALQGPDRPSAEMARRSRLQGQARRRDRLRRHRGDADPGDGQAMPRMSPCCSARRPISGPAAMRSRSPKRCASCRSTRPGSTRSRAARSCSIRTPLPARPSKSPRPPRRICCRAVEAYLGPDYDIATHFTPRYRPWRQRIAFIPDGDLFQGIKSGKASVVTDEIDRFTETGILLKSGKTLEADIIITATGFNLSANGDIEFAIDGKPLDFADTVTYRGMMFTGVPNLVWVFGYFRASWTLRVDLVADFVCRLLNHMKADRREQGHAGAARRKTTTCRCCRGSIRKISTPAT